MACAHRETRLAEPHLRSELARTTFQLRLFADLLDEGSYLEATLDLPDSAWATGPRPGLRRMLRPLGPVLVFAASNFPFAFSVAGSDTAAALAAGCPVVLKAHPSHPQLSQRTAFLVCEALTAARAPVGAFTLIDGDEAGKAALRDRRVRAAAFTGSAIVGRHLFNLAVARPEPIPFHGELGSTNPVFVTPAAAAARGAEIWAGFVDSFALAGGELSTKPGVLLAPVGTAEDALREALASRAGAALLNERIETSYESRLGTLSSHPDVKMLVHGAPPPFVTPSLLATTVRALLDNLDVLGAEVFGPVSLLASYTHPDELRAAARAFPGQLTATVHAEESDPADNALAADLLDELSERAGRVLWNGWPTGIPITPAMTHGGPYPAATTMHSAVGTSAIERFLRPVTYQEVPDALLPKALSDSNPWQLPRWVNR